MKNPNRATVARLEDLPNIGKAIANDLRAIGIHQPQQLIDKDAFALYNLLCTQTGVRHDPCVLDVFMAVIHFMNGGEPLPWWSFTDARKEQTALSLTEEQKTELDRRLDAYETDGIKGRVVDEAVADIRKRL